MKFISYFVGIIALASLSTYLGIAALFAIKSALLPISHLLAVIACSIWLLLVILAETIAISAVVSNQALDDFICN